jgi:hypothetical protein
MNSSAGSTKSSSIEKRTEILIQINTSTKKRDITGLQYAYRGSNYKMLENEKCNSAPKIYSLTPTDGQFTTWEGGGGIYCLCQGQKREQGLKYPVEKASSNVIKHKKSD